MGPVTAVAPGSGWDVSGKTGTAQVISLEGRQAAKGKTGSDALDSWIVGTKMPNPFLVG
jgi:cell division protein FtsI/penicillin-binding protein 2